MAISSLITIWLAFANAFIAIFIMVYAYLFLKKTNEHRDRRPWDYLFIASVIYFVYQVFNIFWLSGVTALPSVDLSFVSNVMAFLYSGCVLLSFISQHDLILRSQIILISKKDGKDSGEISVEIGKHNKKKK